MPREGTWSGSQPLKCVRAGEKGEGIGPDDAITKGWWPLPGEQGLGVEKAEGVPQGIPCGRKRSLGAELMPPKVSLVLRLAQHLITSPI